MTDPYMFDLLPVWDAPRALERIHARPTLGIEVTDSTLASACDLGNLDPQHGEEKRDAAAIEVALEYPLPPDGARLVTVRPDLDAFGSMAVFLLRKQHRLAPACRERIALIAQADKARGLWPGPMPMDDAPPTVLAALAAAVESQVLGVRERVHLVAEWLLTARFTDVEQWNNSLSHDREQLLNESDTSMAAGGRICIVRSRARGVIGLGYRHAPVVVAVNDQFVLGDSPPHRKITIAQYGPGYLELEAVVEALDALEPGWGGTSTIAGSPQGIGSSLHIEQVVALVGPRLTFASLAEASPDVFVDSR